MMGIEIKSFRKFEKNTLKGFLTIELQPSGLEIRDLTYHENQGKKWVNMPAKPYQDTEGNTKYSYIVHFPDQERSQQFQKVILKALAEFQPPKPELRQQNDDIAF